jgi:tetratricopeptide (TPR) repeat protein
MNIKPYIVVIMSLIMSGCATQPQKLVKFDANNELVSIMARYNVSTRDSMNCAERFGSQIDCMTLLDELEQLMSHAPGNSKVMTITALLQYQLGRTLESQYTLDQVLAIPKPAPEAAILRARLALQHGNFALVKRIISNQIGMLPSYGPLYEILALNYYLQGQYPKALAELDKSRMMSSDTWSTDYHYGLIHQVMENTASACAAFEQVLTVNPDHTASKSRLTQLKITGGCG